MRETFKPFPHFYNFEKFFDDLYDQFASPKTWKLYDETREVLKTCRDLGLGVGMISNWDHRLLQLCDAFELTSFFDFMLISAIYGKAKPNQAIFLEAVRRSGFRAEECLHVGDSLEDDVQGAMSAGVCAVWLDRHARKSENQGHITVIQNLKELICK